MKSLMLIIILGVFSCTLKPDSSEAANGVLPHSIQVGDVLVTSRLISSTNRHDSAAKDSSLQALTANNQVIAFQVRIDKNTEPSFAKEQLLYLDFDMQKDFSLLVEQDTIPAGICQRIENGRKHSYEYLVAFEMEPTVGPNEYTLVYQDKVFGAGNVAIVHNP